jgi:hypothetical protein
MELRNRILGVLGAAAVCASLVAAPAALAGDTSSTDVSVEVVCPEYNDVELSGDGEFTDIDLLNDTAPYQSSTINPLQVDVNVGCYLGAWHVDAEINAFDGPGIAFIPGSAFSLTALADSGPLVTAQSAEFSPIAGPPIGDANGDNEVFGTTNIISIPPWFLDPDGFVLDFPAPGQSWATFTGNLDVTTPVIPGVYTAELTVVLTLDPNPDSYI